MSPFFRKPTRKEITDSIDELQKITKKVQPSKGKFHVFRGGNKQYYWHLVSRNGKILAQSEGYERRDKCIKNINRIQEIAGNAVISFHE